MVANILVTTEYVDDESAARLKKRAAICKLDETMSQEQLAEFLPTIDVLLVFSWPKQLSAENLRLMTKLKLVQNILAGVNQVPFNHLSGDVIVCSNAGAYSTEVGEYAMGLLLASAKRIVESHNSIKQEQWNFQRTMDVGSHVTMLENEVLGILGYGGIGAYTATLAQSFGMKIYAWTRGKRPSKLVKLFTGERGLDEVLARSDCVVLALPLTKETRGIIDSERLRRMKKDAILVNVTRGELVDEKALYEHLAANPSFRYATDVWWYNQGRESLKTDYPFLSLPNFVGTPHLSGPSGLATGRPVKLAVDNVLRFLRGLAPRNIVDRSDYVNGR
ncbi:MAG TPA: NAD(P)-dependent oxidoreductase [Candidatus Bathyarchaeia archaeon]|nr:NAD(P)-dependent oxidoreductase [Candidatus Bathyarchaeia archaeon]